MEKQLILQESLKLTIKIPEIMEPLALNHVS